MSTEPTLVSKFVGAAGGRTHYQMTGQGDAVILIHGGGPGASGLSNFRRNIGSLAERHRVIVVDLPGYGQSDARDLTDGLYAPLASAVREVMDGEAIPTASFVGNSLGGGTAIRFALDNPDRTSKLVLMGPGGSVPLFSPFPTEGLLRMLNYYDAPGPSLERLERVIDLLVYDRATISPELIAERFEMSTAPQVLANPPLRGGVANPADSLWRHGIEQISAPTLIIWGREDRVLPLDAAFLLLKLIPNADLHIFSKCGHWAQWERADEFNDLVTAFLGRDR